MRTSPTAWPLASCGATRLCLLVFFVIISGTTYLYLDTHTIHAFLLQIQKDPYGALPVFIAVYIISVVVLFPCMIIQVISGALYGFWMGMLVSWISTSAGQSLAFLLGRYLFRPTVKNYLHSTWPTFPSIDAAIKREGWKLVCLLRLSPVLPYNILNYALAITPVSFGVFTMASSVATVPWTALYVYVGTFSNDLVHLSQGKVNWGSGEVHWVRQLLSGAFILVTSVYGYIVSHRAVLSLLKESSSDAGANSNGTGSNGSTQSLNGVDAIAVATMDTNGSYGSSYASSTMPGSRPPGTSSSGVLKRDVEMGKT